MRYYCKNCGSEFIPGKKELVLPPVNEPSIHCPFCVKVDYEFGIIPDYETPGQYEKRTGKTYPDNGLVWCRTIINSLRGWYEWHICTYCEAKQNVNRYFIADYQIVIIDPPVPPPDDWRPE